MTKRIFLLVVFCLAGFTLPSRIPAVSITVQDSVRGSTPAFLGGNEGAAFRSSDLVDCGANVLRVWTTMGELEWGDDDWAAGGYPGWPTYPSSYYYGSPTIAQIKANANLIPWSVWDAAFTGSRWTGAVPFQTVLDGCRTAGVEPLVVLRTKGPGESWIAWIPNAPDGEEYLQEWWEYCFAVAYWCNIRNSYNVTYFQVHNEPDLSGQGWWGSQSEYVQLIEYARDALTFANQSAGLPVHLHAPIVSNYASSYISYCLDHADGSIDVVDYHVYDKYHDLPTSIQSVRQTIIDHNPDGVLEPVWISEWGDLNHQYDTLARGLLTAEQLYQMADGGVGGSAVFMLYDWGSDQSGLIDDAALTPYDSYYAFRLMLRGLNGGKDVLEVSPSDPAKKVMVTRGAGSVYVLAVKLGETLTVDLSALGFGSGSADLYEYSAGFKDETSSCPAISGGVVSFTVSTEAACCLVAEIPPPTVTASPPVLTPPPRRLIVAADDYDGNGTADLALWRDSDGGWRVREVTTVYYGLAGDVPVPGDYNADGIADVGVWRPSSGRWWVKNLLVGGDYRAFYYGQAGDIPVPVDFDGDFRSDTAVFRPSLGKWFIKGQTAFHFGVSGDIPAPGDFDGDGRAEASVFRGFAQGSGWYVRGFTRLYYGLSGDVPVPGDYNGDGTAQFSVFRPAGGRWYIRGEGYVEFGQSGDLPLSFDHDGDGSAERAHYRPGEGRWYVYNLTTVAFGSVSDQPVSGSVDR